MGDKLPIWSYSNNGDREKIANTYPYYLNGNNFYGMVKLGHLSSGWDDTFERTSENFIKKSSLSFDLEDIVKRICEEDEIIFGDVVIGPISNERDENGELINSEISINLNLDEPESNPQILNDKEVKKGYYQGEIVSYFSSEESQPIIPDWPGLELWVDANVPPANGIWENQIGEQDMEVGGTITNNENEVVFDKTGWATYLINDTDLIEYNQLKAYTVYLIAKAEDVMDQSSGKHQDIYTQGIYDYNSMPQSYSTYLNIEPSSQKVQIGRPSSYLTLSNDTTFWKNYHIYTFTKQTGQMKISAYIDGNYLGDCQYSGSSAAMNVCLYLNCYNKQFGKNPSTLNGYSNYYKLFAYANQVHDSSAIEYYVDELRQMFNVSQGGE